MATEFSANVKDGTQLDVGLRAFGVILFIYLFLLFFSTHKRKSTESH